MLYNLLLPYIHTSHIANLFHYITFRSGIAVMLSLVASLIIYPKFISYLKSHSGTQPIRDDGPKTHMAKVGTPTIGGLVIIFNVIITTFLLADLRNPYIWICFFVLISLTLLGFIDDYAKVKKNNSKGVRPKHKIYLQAIIAFTACLLIQYNFDEHNHSLLCIPFAKNLNLNLGIFFIPFAMIVISGSSNAVNLTDGLDGLVSIPVIIATGSFALICYLIGNSVYANYLQITYIMGASELTILCSSMIGAVLGFLWYNAQPAEIFMGDTGSLPLGGTLGTISLITKHEIVLSIIGGLFVIETLSVIIQVYYFKMTKGKRIFKMAPLHHHFEQLGWAESKVVIRFWIIATIFALIGLSSLKLR